MLRVGGFNLTRQLGAGAMAVVWHGVDENTGREVAVKVAGRRPGADWDRVVADFAREVQAVARMTHPGIIAVHDHGVVTSAEGTSGELITGAPWLAMQLCARGAVDPVTVTDWERLRSILRQVLAALGHAHARGIIHRDIKPQNILEAGAESSGRIALSDFGIAHVFADPSVPTEAESSIGTPRYMAPEQFMGRWQDFGPPTDLYALACVAWHLVTGALVFGGSSYMALAVEHCGREPADFAPRFDVPDRFEAWLRRGLRKLPDERFEDAAQARRELDAIEGVSGPVFPLDWRLPEDDAHDVGWVGAGLFGLREIPFVGREAERDALWAALRGVAISNEPATVVLTGMAGGGKSRLARWMVCRGREVGAAVGLRVDCGPTAPDDAFEAGLAGLLGLRGLGRSSAAERLADRLGADPDDVGDVLAVVSPWLKRDTEVEPPADQRRAAIVRAITDISATRPVIVWLDDAAWSHETIAVVEGLMRAEGRVLILATSRDTDLVDRAEEAERLRELSAANGAWIELGPLDEWVQARLVAAMLELDGAAVRSVVELTEGNPLFAVQLIGDWVARGEWERTQDGLRPGGDAAQLPENVRALWLRRIDDVLWSSPNREQDRVALEVAAILGHRVEVARWREVLAELGLDEPPELPDRLVRRRLAVPAEGGFAFIHGLLVTAIETVCRESGRAARLHEACARVLMRSRSWTELARAGRHYLAAGRASEAIEPLLAAAEGASEVERWRDALDIAETAREALDAAGVSHDALAYGRWKLCDLRGRRTWIPFDEYEARADALVEEARKAGWRQVQAGALQLRSGPLNGTGRADEAAECLFEAADIWADLGEVRRHAQCLMQLSYIFAFMDHIDDALRFGRDALELFESVGDELGVAKTCDRLGFALEGVEPQRALVFLRRGLRLAERHGAAELQGHVLDSMGTIALDAGDLDEALACYERAERRFRAAQVPALWMSHYHRGTVLLRRGEAASAMQFIEPAAAEFEKLGVYNFVFSSCASMVACHALRGDVDRAGTWWERFEEAVARWGNYGSGELREVLEMSEVALAGKAAELAARIRAHRLRLVQ